MKGRYFLTFFIGIVAGASVAVSAGFIFFPAQTQYAISYSLSKLVYATGISLSKPFAFLDSILPQNSLLTKNGVIELTNAERAKQGADPLTENPKLDAAAMVKAQDMFTNQYFEHISPSGKGPSDLDTAQGYTYIMVGENLAEGDFATDKDLIAGWMNSPGHRANILNVRYQEIGVAVLQGMYQGKKVWMAVQEFGMPSSACPATSESLKTEVNADEAQLNAEEMELQQLKAVINTSGPGDPSYNQRVSQYNDLVSTYNALVTKTKTLVAQYNAEVNAFNTCAEAK